MGRDRCIVLAAAGAGFNSNIILETNSLDDRLKEEKTERRK